jgi:uncharacterized damage-inducible protein DinB
MTIDEAKELFGYGSWAMGRMVEAIGTLTPEQLGAGAVSSFPSIPATLGHMVGAEWIWLRRWQGESPPSAPDWSVNPAIPELKVRLAAVEAERASFLADLGDGDLDRVVTYRMLDGKTFSYPLGKLMRHAVNHSTYHRGQLATLLRQCGQVPPNTDFTRFLWEGKQPNAGHAG